MTTYTVKQIASLSGVSVRTLHHYDAIDLLKPAGIGENGYRIYGRKELLRLQQILFHKEIGLSLSDIGALLDDPTFDARKVLEAHKQALLADAARRDTLIKTLTRTLTALSGGPSVADGDLYQGFPPEQQSDYEGWLVKKYGGDLQDRIADSKKAYTKMTAAERADTMAELAFIEQGLADLYLSHPDFEKRYEQIEPGFTAYLTKAMKAYANRAILP